MKRIGLFCDVSNLYYCIKKKYNSRLDYVKYYQFVRDLGEIQQAVAYGAKVGNESVGFQHVLSSIGFAVNYKEVKTYVTSTTFRRKADQDVAIALDMVSMIESLDMVVLGSADCDLVPAVKWCRSKGKDVITIACGISRELRDTSTKSIEIPESLLISPKQEAVS